MNPSETVQAAQRLLAELAEAAQSAFITSESCGATAEYRHVFKFMTLAELQAFRRAWSAVVSMQPTPVTDFNLYTSPQPPTAAATEDAERAAYLARWKYQPVWVNFLSQDADGQCKGWNRKPELQGGTWTSVSSEGMWGFVDSLRGALGSVRCEPRPVQGVGE